MRRALTQVIGYGDHLELRGPVVGGFVWRPEQTEPIQLIAGGSGIVPLMAMIRSRMARPAGRIDTMLIATATLPFGLASTCYVCGPTSFVENVTELLTVSGYDRNRIRTERFGATGSGNERA